MIQFGFDRKFLSKYSTIGAEFKNFFFTDKNVRVHPWIKKIYSKIY